MNPYVKAALFLVRLTGFGLVIVALFLMSGNLALIVSRQPVQKPLGLALEALVLLAGFVLLWKSADIARRMVGGLDDESDESPMDIQIDDEDRG